MATRLIFGCGYLGHRVARRWRDCGDRVYAVTRSATRARQWAAEGLMPLVADVTRDPLPMPLPPAETVLFAIGWDRSTGLDIHETYAGGTRRVLAALPPETGRFIYISSTGVYGGADGGWVDEQTPPNPHRPGGKASLAAEQVLAASPFADRGIILRMAGLYGPGRIPFVDKLRCGEPLAVPAEGWLNLVHIDDAARITVAAGQLPLPQHGCGQPLIVCVSDGEPVARGDYYREAARLLGTGAPVFVPPDPDSPAAARANANRRISHQRLSQLIGDPWLFGNYKAGLASALGSLE